MGKKIYILIIGMLALCKIMQADVPEILWAKVYGKNTDWNYGCSVDQTNDGGFIVCGWRERFKLSKDNNLSDIDQVYLVRTDSSGDTLWTKEYGGEDNDRAYSIQKTSNGGFIVTGYTWPTQYNMDVYLIRIDSLGDTLWTRTIGTEKGEEGCSVDQTRDGGFVITGVHYTGGAIKPVVYLIRVDSEGDTLWTKTYEAGQGYSVKETSDSGFIISGYVINGGAYILRVDSKGDTLWTRKYGLLGSIGWSVQQTRDGGFIVSGENKYVYLIRINSNGDTLWTKTYEEGLRGYSVDLTSDGGFVIAGISDGDAYIMKTDSQGEMLWHKKYGSDFSEVGRCVKQTNDGGYIVVGEGNLDTISTSAPYKFLLLRLDNTGGIIEDNSFKLNMVENYNITYTYLNKIVSINYTIPYSSNVTLSVYDVQGKFIKMLVDKFISIGSHTVKWDIKKDRRKLIAGGAYFIKLSANGHTISKKITIVK